VSVFLRDFRLESTNADIVAIVGGLLLLVNMGPGGISVDEKKKVSNSSADAVRIWANVDQVY
jgi:hypothetical protein